MFSRVRPSATRRELRRAGVLRSSKGLTLLELIVALLILQIALIAFAQFMTRALDYSRRVRRVEMAQILAQAKMEELIRTISAGGAPTDGVGAESTILNKGPGTFSDLAYGPSEDIDSFKWVAETTASEANPKLLELTLHVYVVKRRVKSEKAEKAAEDIEDFYVSENRERFSYTYLLPNDSVEIMVGKEKMKVTSAVAIP